jgi:hypothetical protein
MDLRCGVLNMENINFVYVVFDKKTEEQLIHEKAQCLLRQPQDKWDEWFVYIQHLRDTVENISCGVCSYNRDEEIRDFDITLKNKDLIKTKALQLKRAYAADEEEIVKIKDRICGVNGGLDVPLSSGRKLRIIFEIVE